MGSRITNDGLPLLFFIG